MFTIIDYTPLWSTMEEKGVSQYQLLRDCIVEHKTLDSLKKNKNLTLLTLERICKYLDCTLDDVVRFL